MSIYKLTRKLTKMIRALSRKRLTMQYGGLWTWGANKSGQLGDGTTTDRDTPEKVFDDVKMVAAYGDNAFAIKTDGTLYQWGYGNCFAKLRANGDDTENILTPTPVETDAKFEYGKAAELHDLKFCCFSYHLCT